MPKYITYFSSCNSSRLLGCQGAVELSEVLILLQFGFNIQHWLQPGLLSQSSNGSTVPPKITLTCSWTLIPCTHIYNVIKPTHKHFLKIYYSSATVLQFCFYFVYFTCAASHHILLLANDSREQERRELDETKE